MLVQFLASASVVGCQSRNCTLKGRIVIRIVINHWGTGSELNDFAITVAGQAFLRLMIYHKLRGKSRRPGMMLPTVPLSPRL